MQQEGAGKAAVVFGEVRKWTPGWRIIFPSRLVILKVENKLWCILNRLLT